jgi:hypothetical protein
MAMNLRTETRYVTTGDLARLYPYSANSWRRWAKTGRIRGTMKPLGRILIPFDEANASWKAMSSP